MSTSPSQKKVDDFLSSLSQLSQDRIKQDQQRQRDLQRNIDDLRHSRTPSPVKGVASTSKSSYPIDIPELKFNRGVQELNLNLLTPVARKHEKTPPVVKPKPNITPAVLPRAEKGSGMRSFGQMEQLIKQGTTPEGVYASDPAERTEPAVGGTKVSSPPPLQATPRGQWRNTSIPTQPPEKEEERRKEKEEEDDDDEKPPPPPIRTVKPTYLSSATQPPKVPSKSPSLAPKPGKKDWLTSTLDNSKTKATSSASDIPRPPAKSPTISQTPKPPAKKDWLSSTLDNSKTTVTPTDTPKVPTKSPTLSQISKSPTKKNWLTSTLDNSKTTITLSTSESPPSPPKHKSDWLSSLAHSKTTTSTPQSSESKASPPPVAKKPTSWISSAVKSESSKSLAQIANPSPERKISTKKGNWIDSAVRRTNGVQRELPEKPAYLSNIPKSKSTKVLEEPEQEKEPEFIARRETVLRKTPVPPPVPKKIASSAEKVVEFKTAKLRSASPEKSSTPESAELSEFHSKLNKLRSQSPERKPVEKSSEEKEFLVKFKTVKSTAPPPPLKPKPAAVYNAPPAEFQKRFDQVVANGPKVSLKPTAKNEYARKDAEALQAQLKSLSKPAKPAKGQNSYANKDAEVIQNQLSRLAKPEPAEPAKAETFESKLNGLLSRVNSAPATPPAPSPAGIRRVKTEPANDSPKTEAKLSHPGKGRSKGPKRRLPKSLATSGAPPQKQQEQQEQQPIDISIKKPAPPINKHSKPKPVGELKPSRDFSGELFI
ncbi:uncharacterized protein SPAPADRAFT_50910 [Spathaspora passalidarum NRRL Y-27907]|uniref:Uncharacterized protein n=1 Tax=Spathaspora passalidarum (strain NRRL Y-27907 / 11-Y1) TaxID=619300 RepID=G3AQ25_SPAPN|nr:uncharacterized protein SPAPADRAFT_50910 [Spathaspora passalidarum NRRL Y-27907]EGW32346.1 hypothetical protein SPAPADRAFT_50910 [Spathaspora passalidarum NRRL Y-27907]